MDAEVETIDIKIGKSLTIAAHMHWNDDDNDDDAFDIVTENNTDSRR